MGAVHPGRAYDMTGPAALPVREQVAGRPARGFARWALDHADDFR